MHLRNRVVWLEEKLCLCCCWTIRWLYISLFSFSLETCRSCLCISYYLSFRVWWFSIQRHLSLNYWEIYFKYIYIYSQPSVSTGIGSRTPCKYTDPSLTDAQVSYSCSSIRTSFASTIQPTRLNPQRRRWTDWLYCFENPMPTLPLLSLFHSILTRQLLHLQCIYPSIFLFLISYCLCFILLCF